MNDPWSSLIELAEILLFLLIIKATFWLVLG